MRLQRIKQAQLRQLNETLKALKDEWRALDRTNGSTDARNALARESVEKLKFSPVIIELIAFLREQKISDGVNSLEVELALLLERDALAHKSFVENLEVVDQLWNSSFLIEKLLATCSEDRVFDYLHVIAEFKPAWEGRAVNGAASNLAERDLVSAVELFSNSFHDKTMSGSDRVFLDHLFRRKSNNKSSEFGECVKILNEQGLRGSDFGRVLLPKLFGAWGRTNHRDAFGFILRGNGYSQYLEAVAEGYVRNSRVKNIDDLLEGIENESVSDQIRFALCKKLATSNLEEAAAVAASISESKLRDAAIRSARSIARSFSNEGERGN